MNRILQRLRAYEPPTSFTSFSATFEMVTPISLAHPWICGDALIAERLMREILGDDFYNLPTKAALPVHDNLRLPIKQTPGGVYHASASVFDSDRIYTTTTYKRFDSEHIAHIKRPRSKILRGQGFYKDALRKKWWDLL